MRIAIVISLMFFFDNGYKTCAQTSPYTAFSTEKNQLRLKRLVKDGFTRSDADAIVYEKHLNDSSFLDYSISHKKIMIETLEITFTKEIDFGDLDLLLNDWNVIRLTPLCSNGNKRVDFFVSTKFKEILFECSIIYYGSYSKLFIVYKFPQYYKALSRYEQSK